MKIVYITARTPFGRGEEFILEEMLGLIELNVDLVIVPRNPPEEIVHGKSKELARRAICLSLFNWQILFALLRNIISERRLWKVIYELIDSSRSWKITAKNLLVVPKAVFIASLFKEEKVDHIHAHWGTTTATMAFVISKLSGIPWSFTIHRWDISENNILKTKVDNASFVRAISKEGRIELLGIVGREYTEKVQVIHMGVKISEEPVYERSGSGERFVIVCPANLLLWKGHCYLIEACNILREHGIHGFKCLILGEGPLLEKLSNQVRRLNLTDYIEFYGHIPCEMIVEMYSRSEVDAVILPSIIIKDKIKEGIPVALMEAMAFGIPVISTNSGSIPELLVNNAGIVVEEKSAVDLADAIIKLIDNPDYAMDIGKRGYEKVVSEFNINKIIPTLILQFSAKSMAK